MHPKATFFWSGFKNSINFGSSSEDLQIHKHFWLLRIGFSYRYKTMVPAKESLTEVLYRETIEFFFFGKKACAHMEKKQNIFIVQNSNRSNFMNIAYRWR